MTVTMAVTLLPSIIIMEQAKAGFVEEHLRISLTYMTWLWISRMSPGLTRFVSRGINWFSIDLGFSGTLSYFYQERLRQFFRGY
jgi:hypothetical protein